MSMDRAKDILRIYGSGFLVTGMTEWGKNQNSKKSLNQKLTPTHAKKERKIPC